MPRGQDRPARPWFRGPTLVCRGFTHDSVAALAALDRLDGLDGLDAAMLLPGHGQRPREGLLLTSPDGLLKQLTKTVPETALNQEMLGESQATVAGWIAETETERANY